MKNINLTLIASAAALSTTLLAAGASAADPTGDPKIDCDKTNGCFILELSNLPSGLEAPWVSFKSAGGVIKYQNQDCLTSQFPNKCHDVLIHTVSGSQVATSFIPNTTNYAIYAPNPSANTLITIETEKSGVKGSQMYCQIKMTDTPALSMPCVGGAALSANGRVLSFGGFNKK